MKTLKKVVDGLSKAELFVSSMCLTVIVTLNFYEILQRNLFTRSSPWVQELSLVLICWCVFFGAAYIFQRDSLLCVDFLFAKVKGTAKFIWEMLRYIVEFAVIIIMAVYGWQFCLSQSTSYTYSLQINRGAYSLPLVLCAASMMVGLVEKLADSIHGYALERREKI